MSAEFTLTKFAPGGGIITSTTLTFPELTTPFTTPTASSLGCQPTYLVCSSSLGDPFFHTCTPVHSANSGGYVTFNPSSTCYPPSFTDLARLEHSSVNNDRYGGQQDMLGYPGTACPSGLMPACTTGISAVVSEVQVETAALQTWCCPEDYKCTRNFFSERLCFSVYVPAETDPVVMPLPAAGTENVWAREGSGFVEAGVKTMDPSFTTSVGGEVGTSTYVYFSTIVLFAVPLVDVEVVTAESTAESTSSTTGAETSGETTGSPEEKDESEGSGISGGQVAGIVVGSVAALALGVGGLVFFILGRRKKLSEKLAAEAAEGGRRHGRELDGREVSQVPAGVGLEPDQRPVEAGGDQRPVETGGSEVYEVRGSE